MVKRREGIKKGNRASYGLVNALHGSEEVITKLKKGKSRITLSLREIIDISGNENDKEICES